MNTAIANDSGTAWQNMRRLYPIYSALAREFVIEMQPCRELEERTPAGEAIDTAKRWLQAMDERIQIHQLRQFLQTSSQADETILRELLTHHLTKEKRTDQDRDKLDFLLVQLFSQLAPANISGPSLSLTEAAKVLESVLGKTEIASAGWLASLEDLLGKAYRAKNLNELFTARIIEEGRLIKVSCGEKFFDGAAMVAFARFGFLVRRAFFRLMHQDLNVILDGLRDLEAQGITTLDCRKAQFAADEPTARLQMICQSWKVMFHAEYSSGQPLCILVDLRTAVETALVHAARLGGTKKKAAAAGSGQEFEVAESSSAWDGDATG